MQTILPGQIVVRQMIVVIKDRMLLSSFVWIGYQRVTGGQTDGIAVAITAHCIASNAAAL